MHLSREYPVNSPAAQRSATARSDRSCGAKAAPNSVAASWIDVSATPGSGPGPESVQVKVDVEGTENPLVAVEVRGASSRPAPLVWPGAYRGDPVVSADRSLWRRFGAGKLVQFNFLFSSEERVALDPLWRMIFGIRDKRFKEI
jgi:hypothetical protein